MPGEVKLSDDITEQLVDEYGEDAVEEYQELLPKNTSEAESFPLYNDLEDTLKDMHPDNLSSGVEGIREVEEAVEQYRETAIRYVLESEVEHRDVVLE